MFSATRRANSCGCAVPTPRLPRTARPLTRLEPSTAPAPPRPKVRVSLKIPAKATPFSPAGPMDRVRTSGPKRSFI